MPITGSQSALMPARLGHMRVGASRVGYYQPTLTMTINGVARQAQHLEGLTIGDIADGLPNTASMRVRGFTPIEGQEIRIGLGGLGRGQVIFAGHILSTTQIYSGTPENVSYDLSCISYEWLLNERLVNGTFTSTSATDLVLWIMGYTSGFDTSGVETGMDTLDEITFTDTEVADALEHVSKRIGATWVVDYTKTLHFGFSVTPWSSSVQHITTAAPASMTGIVKSIDLSQVRTRQPVEGGGVNAVTEVPIGETILPLLDIAWYPVTGGTVKSGPQRITYTGIIEGGTGGLVGPGAAPSSGPGLAMAAGAGVESGAHGYAVTFTTAAGESIAGTTESITVGTIPVPTSAPTTASLSSGGSVNAGDHDYEYTFVTATGETTPSPVSSPAITTGGAAASPPASAPTAGTPSTGGSVTDGAHTYAFTFVAASGETAASGSSGSVTTRVVPVPGSAPSAAKDFGGNLSAGAYKWKVTFVNAAGETTPGPESSALTMDEVAAPTTNGSFDTPPAGFPEGGFMDSSAAYGYKYTYYKSGVGETTPSPAATGTSFAAGMAALWDSGVQGAPSGTVRRFYRTEGGGSTYKLMPGPVEGFTDMYASEWYRDYGANSGDASLGANAPSSNTLNYRKANLTGIATSADATVTARNLYRTAADGSTYKLVTTINNNTATTYTDNTADGSLGADAPSSNAATVRTVPLTGISAGPVGTTARKVYRTEAGGSTLKLLTTISNNTTTTFSDTIADGSLGATAPSGSTLNTVNLTGIAAGNVAVTSRKLYRRFNNTGTFKLLTTLSDNTTTTYTDTTANASLGAAAPDTNTATANRVSLTGISLGGATVTGRKVYRTVAAGSTLKLLATLADNTTTTYTDSTADASLGATAPISDTSGLAQPEGQLAAGSTSVLVANSAGFESTGGWAVVGNGELVIRYTGKSASTLTGIPATGVGSLSTAIAYNQTITQAPALIGIPASGAGSILYTIKRGDPVNVFAMVDDVAAQGVMAVLLSTATRAHNGIIEAPLMQDRRLSLTEATTRGRARLDAIKDPLVTIRYQTRDMTTRSGLEVTIALDAPTSISGTFRIQRVTLSQFGAGFTRPLRTVEASSRRLSFEAILRLIKAV